MDDPILLGWSEYTKLLIGLLSLADPVGNLPIVLALTKHRPHPVREKILRSAAVTFVIVLTLFAFIGAHILSFFGITVAALKVAGGILFLFYALEMLGVIQLPQTAEGATKDSQPIGIVPIGIPILAGPGTITKVVIYADLDKSLAHDALVVGAIATAGLIIYGLFRILVIVKPSQTMMTILVKVMGLVLAGIAAEFILEGVTEFL